MAITERKLWKKVNIIEIMENTTISAGLIIFIYLVLDFLTLWHQDWFRGFFPSSLLYKINVSGLQ